MINFFILKNFESKMKFRIGDVLIWNYNNKELEDVYIVTKITIEYLDLYSLRNKRVYLEKISTFLMSFEKNKNFRYIPIK